MLMNMKVEEQDELEHPELFTDIIKIDRVVDGQKRSNRQSIDIIKLDDL